MALRKIERAGHRETAKRVRSFASRVIRYAVATLRADRDPAQLLRGALTAPVSRHHAAITDPEPLGALLRVIDGYPGWLTTRFALRIAPHVFLRPGELRQAEWSEIDFENAIWRLPAHRTKMRLPHSVPLSRQVLAMLTELSAATGGKNLIFASSCARRKPISENTLNQALRRLGYTTEDATAHGFRATASTLLNESGLWSPDAIERALAHRDPHAGRAVYHRGQHWAERVAMAQWWSDYLDELRRDAPAWRGSAQETST